MNQKTAPLCEHAHNRTVSLSDYFLSKLKLQVIMRDVGVGREDAVFQIEVENLSCDEAEQHVDDYHDHGEQEERRCLGQNLYDGCRNSDYEHEEVNEIGSDFL